MPHPASALSLDGGPRSVQKARRWVAEVCAEIGREDLADAARLGVSELTTNAILHGDPPIWLRLAGTLEQPTVEVYDGSRVPPTRVEEQPDDVLAMTGRGLGIVASCSVCWGTTVRPDGKVVWFQPVSDIERAAEERPSPRMAFDAPQPERADLTEVVRLPGLPRELWSDLRLRHRELRRELRLLTLGAADADESATPLWQEFVAIQHEIGLPLFRPDLSITETEPSAADDDDALDVLFETTPKAGARAQQLLGLLELADQLSASHRLLIPVRTEGQRRFDEWLLGEFTRQLQGEEPLLWSDGQASTS